jgi:hypothetical protein
MILLIALLTVIIDGEVLLPRSNWRAIDVRVPQPGTIVKTTFRAPENSSRVQAYLVTRVDADRFARGGALRPLAMTTFEQEGMFHYVAEQAGDFILLLDNRIEGRRATQVHLQVELLGPASTVRTVPPERRRFVELASVMFFLAVVAYSARQLMR